jgi:hypothetical protein
MVARGQPMPEKLLMGGVYGSSKNAATRLANFAAEVPARVAKELAPVLDEFARDMFANEEDVYGRPWAPLAASTVRRKRGNSVILSRTNNLGPGTYVLYTGRRLVFTYGPGAQYAQDGDAGRGNRPPRLLAPAYGVPKAWKAAAAAAAARVAKKGAA